MGAHWGRFGFHRDDLGNFVGWGTALWGAAEKMTRGRHFHECGLRWATGAEVWYNEDVDGTRKKDRCTLDLSGGVLEEWTADEQLAEFEELLLLGVDRMSRFDVALDLFGHGLTLIDDLQAACERREYARFRRWSPQLEMNGRAVVGRGIRLGRQSRNGKMVQVYDKGVETGLRPAGEHVRWESRFYGKRAWLVFQRLLAARRFERTGVVQEIEGLASTWRLEAVRCALGAVDFREVRPNRNGELKRRPQAAWWKEFLDGIEAVHVRAVGRCAASFVAYRAYFKRQVGPTLKSMVRIRGGDLDEVLVDLGFFEGKFGGRSELLAEYERRVVGMGVGKEVAV